MKIEIDLDDIFRDEDGPSESLEESIRRQVLEKLSSDLRKRMFTRIDAELSEIMRDQINSVMKEKMPELIDDIMNVTYTPVSAYGTRGEPTTFRDELVKAMGENMKYAPKNYPGDENAFTKAVRSIVDQKTKAIQDEITKQVDVQFKNDALAFAVKKLSERLGLNK